LRRSYPELIAIEVGNWAAFQTPNDRLKTDYLLRSLRALRFDVYNVTPYDIAFGTTHPLQVKEDKGQLVAANLFVEEKDGATTKLVAPYEPYVILERKTTAGQKIRVGVIGITDPSSLEDVFVTFLRTTKTAPKFQVAPVGDTLKKYVPEVRRKADYVVVLAMMDRKNAPLTAQIIEGVDMLVTTWGVQTSQMNMTIGATTIVNTGYLGRYFNQETVNFDGPKPVKVMGSLLDIPSDGQKIPAMTAILDEYKEKTKLLDEQIRKQVANSRWVGRNQCLNCHRNQYMQWVRTPHNLAYNSLVEKRQHYNPDCLKCHVTGYGEEDGFINTMQSSHLVSVQCESCHGPGRDHVSSMTLILRVGQVQAIDKSTTPKMIVQTPAVMCLKCHDPDNSPAFNYEKDLPLISHKNTMGPFSRSEARTSGTLMSAPPVDLRRLKPNPSVPTR
jgi:hypothetical protein